MAATFSQYRCELLLSESDARKSERKRVALDQAKRRVEQLAPDVFDQSEPRNEFFDSTTALDFYNEYGVDLFNVFAELKAENRRENLKRFSDFFSALFGVPFDDEDPLDFILDLAIYRSGISKLSTVTQLATTLEQNYGSLNLYIDSRGRFLIDFIESLSQVILNYRFEINERQDIIRYFRATEKSIESDDPDEIDPDYFNTDSPVYSGSDFYDLLFQVAFKNRDLRRYWKVFYNQTINQLSDEFKKRIDANLIETSRYVNLENSTVENLPVLDVAVVGGGPLGSYAGQMLSTLSNVTLISNGFNPNPWNSRPIFPNSDSADGKFNDYRGPLLEGTTNPISIDGDAGAMTAGQAQDFEDSLTVECADGAIRNYGAGPDVLGDSVDVNSAMSFSNYLLHMEFLPELTIPEVVATNSRGNTEEFTRVAFEDKQTNQIRYFLVRKLYVTTGPGIEKKGPVASPIFAVEGNPIPFAEFERQRLLDSIQQTRDAIKSGEITIEEAKLYIPRVLSYFDLEKIIEFWIYDLNYSEDNFPLEFLFLPENEIIIAGGGDTGLVVAEIIRKFCSKNCLPQRILNKVDNEYAKILITGAKFNDETDIRRRYRRLLQNDSRILAERISRLVGETLINQPMTELIDSLDLYINQFDNYNSGKILVDGKRCIDFTTLPATQGGGFWLKTEDETFIADRLLDVAVIVEEKQEKSGDSASSTAGVRITFEVRDTKSEIKKKANRKKVVTMEIFPEVKVYTDPRKAVFVRDGVTGTPKQNSTKDKNRVIVTLEDNDGRNQIEVEGDYLITATGIQPLDFESIYDETDILTDALDRPNRKAVGRFIRILGSLNQFKLDEFPEGLREIIILLAKENTAALWVWGTLLESGLWDEMSNRFPVNNDKINRLFESLSRTSLLSTKKKALIQDALYRIFQNAINESENQDIFGENNDPINLFLEEGTDNRLIEDYDEEDQDPGPFRES